MAGLRRLDAFAKTRPELQNKSAVGGIITLVATLTAAVLFVAQIFMYISGDTRHSLHLSQSTSVPLLPVHSSKTAQRILHRVGTIPLFMHVTFPTLRCDQLDIVLDGAVYSSGELEKVHGKHSLTLRSPTTQEWEAMKIKRMPQRGCTVIGTVHPQVVAGILSICMSQKAWTEAANLLSLKIRGETSEEVMRALDGYNVSHYIHKIEFGKTFSRAAAKPLEKHGHMISNDYGGIAIEEIRLKLVPTKFQGFLFKEHTYQMSVVEHTIQPHTLLTQGMQSLPGLLLIYDYTPLAVHHVEGRDNILVFLSSLVSIVGGVFVTVSLLTGCLVHSAKVVAKKVD